MDQNDIRPNSMTSNSFDDFPVWLSLPEGYLDAGKEYHTALMHLGLSPELTIWARDSTIDDWVLLVCTSLLDSIGPLSIMQVLFDAFDRSATPKTISPFNVRLQSPKQNQMQAIMAFLAGGGYRPIRTRYKTVNGDHEEAIPAGPSEYDEFAIADLHVRAGWRYVAGTADKTARNALDPYKTFKRFKRNVQNIAA